MKKSCAIETGRVIPKLYGSDPRMYSEIERVWVPIESHREVLIREIMMLPGSDVQRALDGG